jgi:type IV pilus assembly protein PilA
MGMVGGHRGARLVREESGFTLVELIVVTLVIGLLAAIAVPAFFGQRAKGADTGAISNVRNLQELVAECRVETGSYSECQTAGQLHANSLTFGTGPGDVQVLYSPLGLGGVVEMAVSPSGTTFANWTLNGQDSRLCIPASGVTLPRGSCIPGGAFGAYGYGTW